MSHDYGSIRQDNLKDNKKQANITRASIHGKITATHTGRRYDISVPGGYNYRKVETSVPDLEFGIGDWVIMEYTISDWQIIGYSGQIGE